MRSSESLSEAELSFSESPGHVQAPPFDGGSPETRAVPRIETRISSARLAGTPWWLWWNLLSLDAPTVALVWAAVFARVGGIQLGAASEVVLGLAVFLIYAIDRLLDGWNAASGADLQERHLFCARHRRVFVVSATLAAAGILWMAARALPITETRAGVALASIVAVYILAIQVWRGLATRLPSKEWAVGILFAAGTTLPLWSRAGKLESGIWLLIIMFGLLCALNCLLIDSWESEIPARNSASAGHLPVGTWSAILGLGAAIFSWSERIHAAQAQAFSAIALGAILLLVLNEQRRRLSRPALRVLADAALVVAGLMVILIGR
jgi:hypothetical protein